MLSIKNVRNDIFYSVNGLECGDVGESDRVDCGWAGITEACCLQQDCCYDTTSSNKCYYKAGKNMN